MAFEYKVVPAPKKATKVKGLKRGEDKFAASLAQLMNEFGAQGWEYQRTDTLPVETRTGLTTRVTTFENMLVFRRALPESQTAPAEIEEPGDSQVQEPEPQAAEFQGAGRMEPALTAAMAPGAQEMPLEPQAVPLVAQAVPPAAEPQAMPLEPQAMPPAEPMPMPVAPEPQAIPPAPQAMPAEPQFAPAEPQPMPVAPDPLPDNVAEFDLVRPVFRRRTSESA